MTASTKNTSKGAGKGKASKATPAKSVSKKASPKSASKTATAPAKKTAAKKPGARKAYSRDARWRLLGTLVTGDLRHSEIGQKGQLAPSTFDRNLKSVLEQKLVEYNAEAKTYRLTESGRQQYLAHLQSASSTPAADAAPVAKVAKVAAKKPVKAVAKETTKVAAKPMKKGAALLPPPVAEALASMAAPHSVPNLDAKLKLLESLAPKVHTAIGSILLEISADLRRVG